MSKQPRNSTKDDHSRIDRDILAALDPDQDPEEFMQMWAAAGPVREIIARVLTKRSTCGNIEADREEVWKSPEPLGLLAHKAGRRAGLREVVRLLTN